MLRHHKRRTLKIGRRPPKTLKGGMMSDANPIETLFSLVSGTDNPAELKKFASNETLPSGWVDADGTDKYNLTPLMRAAKAGNTQIVKMLLDEYAANIDKQARISKYTALQQAVYYGNVETARVLILHGADPRLKNIYGEDAYFLAEHPFEGPPSKTAVVLKNGATSEIREIAVGDESAVRALYVACQSDYMGDEAGRRVHEKWTQRRLETDFADPVAKYTGPRTRFWVATVPAAVFKTLTGETIEPLFGADGTAVIGSVAVQPIASAVDVGEVMRMCAHPGIRRSGIASIMLSHLETWAASVGYKTLRLTTLAHMTAAVEFYKSRGYKLTTVTRKNYADAVIELSEFEKTLVAPAPASDAAPAVAPAVAPAAAPAVASDVAVVAPAATDATNMYKYIVVPDVNSEHVIEALKRRDWIATDATFEENKWDFCWDTDGTKLHSTPVERIQVVSCPPKAHMLTIKKNLVQALRNYYGALKQQPPEIYIINKIGAGEYNEWLTAAAGSTWVVNPATGPSEIIKPFVSNSTDKLREYLESVVKPGFEWTVERATDAKSKVSIPFLVTHNWNVYVASTVSTPQCNELILDAICATRGQFAIDATRPWFALFSAEFTIDAADKHWLNIVRANPSLDVATIDAALAITVDRYFAPKIATPSTSWELIWSDTEVDPMHIPHQISMSKHSINVETMKARGDEAVRLAMTADGIGDWPKPVKGTTTSFITSRFIGKP